MAFKINDVCRLCPTDVQGQKLINVFTNSLTRNIREVILLTTGIEINESDLVSKHICQRCCKILLNWYDFRLDAIKQDRNLKEKCNQLLGDKGFRLPNSCITIKKQTVIAGVTKVEPKVEPKIEPCVASPSVKNNLKKRFHPSVKEIYMNYPHIKIPSKCLDKNLTPVVSLAMGEVENYFKKRKLDMKRFIYKPGCPQLIAQKETEKSQVQKTVAPLKISKKLLENCNDSESSTDGDVISSRPLKGKKRVSRRFISTSESDGNEDALRKKLTSIETKDVVPKHSVIVPKIPEIPDQASIPSPVTSELNHRSPSPAPIDALSENSRDSCTTSISEATSESSSSVPEFMETFGSIPKVTTTKSHTLLVCNLCGSVHNNGFEFRRHTKRHMMCQFCKVKFKSLEKKDYHVENKCEIKKMMNSSAPIVQLEKIHLNLEVRKKYKSAFSAFKPILEYDDVAPLEQVVIKAASPPPTVEANDIIVLSDDEGMSVTSHDPLSDYSAPSFHTSAENVYTTVSIVRPDIRIKNNTILQTVGENMADRKLIEALLHLTKTHITVEKMLQTDLPASKDLKVNLSEKTCIFKNLKGQLISYKIPITMTNGSFDVSYQFKNSSKVNKSMALWNDLPVMEVGRNPPQNDTASGSHGQSGKSSNENSQVNTPSVVVTSIPYTTNKEACSSSVSHMMNIQLGSNTSNYTLMNNPANPIVNVSNSATPLLQNYALSMPVPVVNNPIPIPRTFINSALSNSAVNSNRNMSSGNGSSRLLSMYLTDGQNRPASSLNNNNMSVRNSTGPPNKMVLPTGQFSSYPNSANALGSPTVISSQVVTMSNPSPGNIPSIISTVSSVNSSRSLYSNQSSANILPSTTTSSLSSYPTMRMPNLLPLNQSSPSTGSINIISSKIISSPNQFYLVSSPQNVANNSSVKASSSTATTTPLNSSRLLSSNQTSSHTSSMNISSSTASSNLPGSSHLIPLNQTSENISTLTTTSPSVIVPNSLAITQTSTKTLTSQTTTSSTNIISSNQLTINSSPITSSSSSMTVVQPMENPTSLNSTNPTPPPKEQVRFRVKNVWELQ